MRKEYFYHGVTFVIWVTLNVASKMVQGSLKPDKNGAVPAVMVWNTVAVHDVNLQIEGDSVITVRTASIISVINELETKAKAMIDKKDVNDPAYLLEQLGFKNSK